MAFVQAADTASLVWRNGQVDTVQKDGYDALLRSLVTFLAGKAFLSVSYVGTGNGQIDNLDGGVGAPTETWTITFTSATAFTVSGSVSGAQPGGTVGVAYTTTGDPLTSLLSFTIFAGATPFVAADAFTVLATVSSLPAFDTWVLDRWNPNADLSDIDEALIWHGLGDGAEAIHCGIRLTATPASQIWNWVLRNYTGFSASDNFETQPGISTRNLFTAFWDNDMTYWFSGNSRRYIVSAKVSTTFHALYQGFMLPFGSPGEYPFPSIVIGEKSDEEAFNSTSIAFGMFVEDRTNHGSLRDTAGVWLDKTAGTGLTRVNIWPNVSGFSASGNIWDNHENHSTGDHQLFPLMLVQSPTVSLPLTGNNMGVLDGANIVTGFGNSSETILSIGGTDWVVFQDIFRVTRESFWAMEMA